MKDIEEIKKYLKIILSEKRYLHSIATMKMAIKLAKKYNIDTQKAALTALTHDIGKELSYEEKLKYAKDKNIEIDEIERKSPGLLHGKIGANIVKEKYAFSKDMQDAIKYHTTGHPNMDLLAKIIFVADKIEETRDYEDVEKVRKLAFEDIDKCIIYILNYNIKANTKNGKPVHENSILTIEKLKNETDTSLKT